MRRATIGLLALTIGASCFSQPLAACTPRPLHVKIEQSDVVVKGRFVRDANHAGRGRIELLEHEKGPKAKSYPVQWDPNAGRDLPPHMRACLVGIPQDGTVAYFALVNIGDGSFMLAARWQKAKQ